MASLYYYVLVEASVIAMMMWGSVQDLKKREVEDYVWLIALLPLAINVYTFIVGQNLISLRLWLVELPLLAGMGLLFYYLGLFGGADAKALMALGVSMPQPIPPFRSQIGLFGVTVFDNGVVLAVIYAAIFALVNLLRMVFIKGYLGRYASASMRTKIGLVLYAYKTTVREYVENSYKLFLAEKPVFGQDAVEFKPTFGLRLDSEDEAVNNIRALLDSGRIKLNDEIWVSQGLPLIVFMFLGMAITPITGDLVFRLIGLFLR